MKLRTNVNNTIILAHISAVRYIPENHTMQLMTAGPIPLSSVPLTEPQGLDLCEFGRAVTDKISTLCCDACVGCTEETHISQIEDAIAEEMTTSDIVDE